jgi:hypothetical protein
MHDIQFVSAAMQGPRYGMSTHNEPAQKSAGASCAGTIAKEKAMLKS